MLDSMYKIWLFWSNPKIFVKANAQTWTLLNWVYVSDSYFTDIWWAITLQQPEILLEMPTPWCHRSLYCILSFPLNTSFSCKISLVFNSQRRWPGSRKISQFGLILQLCAKLCFFFVFFCFFYNAPSRRTKTKKLDLISVFLMPAKLHKFRLKATPTSSGPLQADFKWLCWYIEHMEG